jgi:6-phosphofructokinase
MILEVMGRDSAQIALAAGIPGGADVILVPEIPYRVDTVAAHIGKMREGAHNFAIIVVAEGVRSDTGEHVERRHALGNLTHGGIGIVPGEAIARMTGAETRATVLGHVQGGGQPTWDDRLFASAFGVHGVDLIAEGRFDRLVSLQKRRVVDVPLTDAFEETQIMRADHTLVQTARGLGICLGDE